MCKHSIASPYGFNSCRLRPKKIGKRIEFAECNEKKCPTKPLKKVKKNAR